MIDKLEKSDKSLGGKHIGIAITGSFCTFDIVLECIEELKKNGATLTAILSDATAENDTKFGTASDFKSALTALTGNPIISTLPAAEPIGPGKMLEVLIVLPATGNTLAKLAAGIADTPASFAVKCQLRNERPVVIGISSNDALGTGAKNIGHLLNAKNIYFIPFGQDDHEKKPRSIVFKKEQILPAILKAVQGQQIQPILAHFC